MATEYFQSALFANEMDAAWLNNVRYDKEQNLSETQKAQARNNIGAVAFGSLLKILGHYDTIEALQSNGEQKAGNAYSVGTAVPYKLYVFDGLSESWMDYGYIRSQDISSRSIQNVAVSTSAWVQDTAVFAGYNYKAQIALADSTAECFPIVVFEPEQAFSGNFAPVSFAVAGYLEIFAKEIPTKSINILSVTVIVNGGVGKGITNATSGITVGSIGTASLADGVVTAPKIANGAVTHEKLSMNARCGLVISASAGKNLENSDAGNTYFAGWTSTGSTRTWTLNANLSAAISNGFAVAFTELWPSDKTRISISGVRLLHRGEGQLLGKNQSAVLGLVERCNMIALQKMFTDAANGDVWLITGDVEVIS